MKKIIGLIIALTLCFSCLASCSNKKAEEKGGYVEEECSIPEEAKSLSSSICSLKELDNNDIVMILCDENDILHKYISKDSGRTWNKGKLDIPSIPSGNSIQCYDVKVDRKGNIYLFYSYLPTDTLNSMINENGTYITDIRDGIEGYENKFVKIDPNGKIKNIELDSEFTNKVLEGVNDTSITNDNIFYLTSYDRKIYTLNCDTGEIKRVFNENGNYFAINNKSIVSDCSGNLKYYDRSSFDEKGDVTKISMENQSYSFFGCR